MSPKSKILKAFFEGYSQGREKFYCINSYNKKYQHDLYFVSFPRINHELKTFLKMWLSLIILFFFPSFRCSSAGINYSWFVDLENPSMACPCVFVTCTFIELLFKQIAIACYHTFVTILSKVIIQKSKWLKFSCLTFTVLVIHIYKLPPNLMTANYSHFICSQFGGSEIWVVLSRAALFYMASL